MISPTERMIAETDGAIGWMMFNNPARRNALSLDMWQAMPVILDHFERDPDVRVIVLRGAGDKAFISGADISQFEKQRSSADSIAQYDKIAEGALAALQEVSKPTIAMIHGFCIGGGLGIALGCDHLRRRACGSSIVPCRKRSSMAMCGTTARSWPRTRRSPWGR